MVSLLVSGLVWTLDTKIHNLLKLGLKWFQLSAFTSLDTEVDRNQGRTLVLLFLFLVPLLFNLDLGYSLRSVLFECVSNFDQNLTLLLFFILLKT